MRTATHAPALVLLVGGHLRRPVGEHVRAVRESFGVEVFFTRAVVRHLACPLDPLPFLRVRRVLGQAGHYVSHQRTSRTSRTVERNPMTIHISGPIDNEKIHNTADGADQYLDIVACPECSMAAALQRGGRVESTDGPVDHVRITCVNRHWFLMPADTLNEQPQNH